ncbi:MAG: response regulator transcription factor [Polyangiaceae bacterium]
MRVLVVDDDVDVRELLATSLVRDGHVVLAVGSAGEAQRLLLDEHAADVVVLDLALPDSSGIELCRTLRTRGCLTPILMLTAHSEVARRIESLDAGMDDFLGKPFAVAELCARVRALGRRRAVGFALPVIERGELHIDFNSRRARRRKGEVALTPREWALLESLALRRGQVVSREELLFEVWGEVSDGSSASLDVHVGRIRRKLAAEVIRTLRNQGYALVK